MVSFNHSVLFQFSFHAITLVSAYLKSINAGKCNEWRGVGVDDHSSEVSLAKSSLLFCSSVTVPSCMAFSKKWTRGIFNQRAAIPEVSLPSRNRAMAACSFTVSANCYSSRCNPSKISCGQLIAITFCISFHLKRCASSRFGYVLRAVSAQYVSVANATQTSTPSLPNKSRLYILFATSRISSVMRLATITSASFLNCAKSFTTLEWKKVGS